MSVKRYAVLNNVGQCINSVLIDDPMPQDYWPGYGATLVCCDGTPNLTKSAGLSVLNITPDKPIQIGDVVNTDTGVVTKFVPTISQDEKGGSVVSAPSTKLAKDVEPTKTLLADVK